MRDLLMARWRLLVSVGVVVTAGVVVAARVFGGGGDAPTADTAAVVRGEYTDVLEIRGEIQPVRSTYVTAPYNAGELQIITIAKNGTLVKAGDVVAEFDAVTLRRTIQEKQSELRSTQAQLEQGDAQSSIALEEKKAAVSKAEFDVQRATLSLGEIGLVSENDAERAKLEVADAGQRLMQAQAALASAEANAAADHDAHQRAIDKTQAELTRAERQTTALQVTAPTDGAVNIMPNYRSTTPMGVPQEYRSGDRAYPGATILELPDLSSVFLTARIDEADRGQLAVGQPAAIRIDAIPDRDYAGAVREILLARADGLHERLAAAQAVRPDRVHHGSG